MKADAMRPCCRWKSDAVMRQIPDAFYRSLRGDECGLWTRSPVETRGDYMLLQSGLPRPLGDCLRGAMTGNGSIRSLVVRLLDSCGPHAILRRVRAVVVLAFNAVVFGWPRPHVGNEVRVAGPPGFADVNTAALVVTGVVGIRAVSAPGFHAAPDFVFRRESAPIGASVLGRNLYCSLPMVTAATDDSSSNDVRAADCFLRSTPVAGAKPVRVSGRVISAVDHGQKPEYATFRHEMLRHMLRPFYQVNQPLWSFV